LGKNGGRGNLRAFSESKKGVKKRNQEFTVLYVISPTFYIVLYWNVFLWIGAAEVPSCVLIKAMTSPTLSAERQFIDLIAGELASGVHAAVRRWMGEIEQVLGSGLSDSAKLLRIREIAAHAGCNPLKEQGRIV